MTLMIFVSVFSLSALSGRGNNALSASLRLDSELSEVNELDELDDCWMD